MTVAENARGEQIVSQPEAPRSVTRARKVRVSRMGGASRKSETAFRTISEVAEELDVQQHVLRFWETKFSQVKPLKRGGGRRYYRPEDFALLKSIHKLLYTDGLTIKGVQKLLKEQGKAAVIESVVGNDYEDESSSAIVLTATVPVHQDASSGQSASLTRVQRAQLEDVLSELKALRASIASAAE